MRLVILIRHFKHWLEAANIIIGDYWTAADTEDARVERVHSQHGHHTLHCLPEEYFNLI